MEIKVRALDDSEEKSSQQVEQELLDKHAEKQEPKSEDTTQNVEGEEKKETVETETSSEPQTENEEEKVELTEEDVLSHINKRYNKEIKSVDDLFKEKESQEDLPEDVAAYLKYKQETGRGFDDYVKLNKDFDKLSSTI